MIEKLLKALLIFNDKEFPKTHDLIALATLIEQIYPEIKNRKTDLEFLSRYYVETRYPGDYPEFTVAECENALESARRIREFVYEKISKQQNVPRQAHQS